MVQTLAIVAAIAAFLAGNLAPVATAERPVRIVAFGDSLTAGFGLPASASFPAKLATALKAAGHSIEMTNAGVSGDTASGGLARLDWSVPDGTDAVILELGANDMLRGIDPKITRHALDEIVGRLAARGIAVLVTGMRAIPNLGRDFSRDFEVIYPEIAAKHGALFYPFFLEGIAGEARFNQGDRVHPLASGVDVIVTNILPKVEELLTRARNKPAP